MIKENEPDYIKRMHEELDMLELRIEKLKAFYNMRYMRRLPEFTCYLMKKQLKQMKVYQETLKLRIKYEESEVKEHEDSTGGIKMKTIYVVSAGGYGDGPVFGDAFLSKDEAVKQAEEYTADKVDDLVYYVDEVKLHED